MKASPQALRPVRRVSSDPGARKSRPVGPIEDWQGLETVQRRLAERGFDFAPRPEESREQFEVRSETALMALFRDDRDDEAFEALYRHASGKLLSWILACSCRIASAPDPNEVLQDAFVNIYRYASSFRDERPKSFRVWSRTIASNLLRRGGAASFAASLQGYPEGMQEPADTACGPAREAILAEECAALSRAWGTLLLLYLEAWRSLSTRDRRALELVEVEGKSYAEACRELRVGMSNMKMIMFRSRRRIRAYMKRAMGQEFEEVEEHAHLVRIAG